MSKFLLLLTDAHGRPTFCLADNPYTHLAYRVADGLLTAKQASTTQVFAVEENLLDKTKLTESIAFEQLVLRSHGDRGVVVELFNKKKLSLDGVEAIRAELTRRSIYKDEDWSPPWPWAENTEDLLE